MAVTSKVSKHRKNLILMIMNDDEFEVGSRSS